jgi:hypothetical protein
MKNKDSPATWHRESGECGTNERGCLHSSSKRERSDDSPRDEPYLLVGGRDDVLSEGRQSCQIRAATAIPTTALAPAIRRNLRLTFGRIGDSNPRNPPPPSTGISSIEPRTLRLRFGNLFRGRQRRSQGSDTLPCAPGEKVRHALAQCHERWNGRGGPKRLRADEIELAARIFHVAHDAEVLNRIGGIDRAVSIVRRRGGKQYDPDVAQRFCDIAQGLFRELEEAPDGVYGPWVQARFGPRS